MSPTHRPILTIGHSTHELRAFVDLLRTHNVTAVADVRSSPFSRFNPQFNRDAIQDALALRDIAYVFLGRELGARSNDPDHYEKGRVQYARLARSEKFQQGLDRVIEGATKHVVALMCAEKEPLDCHRTLLVARALVDRGIEVAHILGDGRLEPYQDSMVRLLGVLGLPKEHLFKDLTELVEEALVRQEARIAYVDEELVPEVRGGQK